MTIKHEIDETVGALRQQRDELKVKMHLASMEVREEWDELETRWGELVDKSRNLKKQVDPAVEDIGDALALLTDELKAGYKKLKSAL